jgi:hypothetical protein
LPSITPSGYCLAFRSFILDGFAENNFIHRSWFVTVGWQPTYFAGICELRFAHPDVIAGLTRNLLSLPRLSSHRHCESISRSNPIQFGLLRSARNDAVR